MKKQTKKGFTLVELVIVIAVIAILSAILIPTFGSVISNANDAAALDNAKTAYTNFLVENGNKLNGDATESASYVSYADEDAYILVEPSVTENTTNIIGAKYCYKVVSGKLTEVKFTEVTGANGLKLGNDKYILKSESKVPASKIADVTAYNLTDKIYIVYKPATTNP